MGVREDPARGDEMVRLRRTVRSPTGRRCPLAQEDPKPCRRCGAFPSSTPSTSPRIDDVVTLHAGAPDRKRPVLCVDFTPKHASGPDLVELELQVELESQRTSSKKDFT